MLTNRPGEEQRPQIWTVGHSNRSIEDFLEILKAHSITRVIDVRTVPRSRYNPQFNKDVLPGSLQSAGIGYLHLPGLGGLRHARKDSPNTGWHNASFRGFADYMQTSEFTASLGELLTQTDKERVALMCAEALPWRCHRSLIADALLARGIAVQEILTATNSKPHKLTPFAKVEGTTVTYPSEQGSLL